ncbi:signal peptide peptidase SppA, partial [bacterium]|nr:signal peptide peptidase SppA [bacterium]
SPSVGPQDIHEQQEASAPDIESPVQEESVTTALPGEEPEVPVGMPASKEEQTPPPSRIKLDPALGLPIAVILLLLITIGLGFSLSATGGSGGSAGLAEAPAFGEFLEGVVEDHQDGVAVVKIYGVIQTQDEGGVFSIPRGADQTLAQLRKLGKKKNVKAIVLRINSPGGTVGASQEIYQEISKLKKKGIKIVVSMADLCASGGVYIAVAADKIVANPGTITGSVGVIFSVPNLFSLMEKIGVKMNTVKSGTFKDIGSYSREMTEPEKALLQEAIDSTYEQFLKAVAEGRGLEPEEVRKWADGRIFNGEKALEYKLVDQLGSLEDAIDLAHKLADLEKRHIIRPRVNPFDRFQSLFHNWLNPLQSLTSARPNAHVPFLFYFPGWKTL